MYNSLEYVKNMEQAGFTRKQADATVTFVVETMDKHFATKQDFTEMRADMQHEFKDVRTEMATEFRNVRTEMATEFTNVRTEMATEFSKVRTEMALEFQKIRTEMMALEHRMTLKLGAMIFASMTILLAALPYLIKIT